MNASTGFGRLLLGLALSLVLVQLGSAGVLFRLFETHFETVPEATVDSLRGSALRRTFTADYEKTWDAVLAVLTQQAFLVRISKEKGRITFFDVDGLLIAKRFDYMEFPYALLVERRTTDTTVYLLPLADLYENQISGNDRRKVESALVRKGEALMEQFEVQLTAGDRWRRFSDAAAASAGR